jgi:hypothetical protein
VKLPAMRTRMGWSFWLHSSAAYWPAPGRTVLGGYNTRHDCCCSRTLAGAGRTALAGIATRAARLRGFRFGALASTLASCARAGVARTVGRVGHGLFSFLSGSLAVNGISFSPKPVPGIERSSYWRWMNRLIFAARAGSRRAAYADTLNGDPISAKVPRIKTDGAIPTI